MCVHALYCVFESWFEHSWHKITSSIAGCSSTAQNWSCFFLGQSLQEFWVHASVSTACQHVHYPTAHTTCSYTIYTCMNFMIAFRHIHTTQQYSCRLDLIPEARCNHTDDSNAVSFTHLQADEREGWFLLARRFRRKDCMHASCIKHVKPSLHAYRLSRLCLLVHPSRL